MPDKTRILIAGAGPVGLTLAIELTRYGIPVRIVDKAAARTSTSKALALWSRTLELLHPTGLVPQFLDSGFKCHGTKIVAGPGFTLVGDPADTKPLAAQFPALIAGTETGPFEDVLWLVRPDGYVGLTARSDDGDAVRQYLLKIAG